MRAWHLVAGVVAGVLAADAVLVARGEETVSEWWARNLRWTAPPTIYLFAHLAGHPRWLRPIDPLSAAASAIRTRSNP